MKDFEFYLVDYCMYSDWGYKKRTRIWTNKKDWDAKLCDGKGTCGNMVGKVHKTNLGNTKQRQKTEGISLSQNDRYRIPEELVFSLFLEI